MSGTAEILNKSLQIHPTDPAPPMPDGLYMPTDAEVAGYMLAKLNQVVRSDGYGSVLLQANGTTESRLTATVYTIREIGSVLATNLTDAIAIHNEKVKNYSSGQEYREQAARLIAKAEAAEAASNP